MSQTVKPFLTSTAACSGFYIGTLVIPIPAEGSAACASVQRQWPGHLVPAFESL